MTLPEDAPATDSPGLRLPRRAGAATAQKMAAVEIIYNGAPHEVAEGTTVAALLARLELAPRYVAVELNEQVVPRARHADCHLHAGDHVEIVTLVGGG